MNTKNSCFTGTISVRRNGRTNEVHFRRKNVTIHVRNVGRDVRQVNQVLHKPELRVCYYDLNKLSFDSQIVVCTRVKSSHTELR